MQRETEDVLSRRPSSPPFRPAVVPDDLPFADHASRPLSSRLRKSADAGSEYASTLPPGAARKAAGEDRRVRLRNGARQPAQPAIEWVRHTFRRGRHRSGRMKPARLSESVALVALGDNERDLHSNAIAGRSPARRRGSRITCPIPRRRATVALKVGPGLVIATEFRPQDPDGRQQQGALSFPVWRLL